MARPIKNNMDYFPHDNKMRNDRKIKALRAKYGLEGYAIYNMLLEILCEAELLVIKWDETEIELVSGDLTIVSDKLTEITEYLCKIKLLNKVNGWLFCVELDNRSEAVFGKRIRDLGSLRSGKGINVTETPISATEGTQSKVKESKVNKSNSNTPDKKQSGGNKYDFIDSIVNEFREAYEEINNIPYEITAIGKERGMAGKLLNLYKKKNPEADSEKTLADLRHYFELCVKIEDSFLNENMSLGIIINQFNKINKILRHGRSKRAGTGASEGDLAEVVARNFGTDYTGPKDK